MKTILTAVMLIIASNAFGQSKITIEEDTVKYQGQKFYVGKEFQLGTGSEANKTFAFIYKTDPSYTNVRTLDPVYAKSKFIVEKVYNTNRGWSVQTHLPDRSVGANGKVIKGEIVFFLVEKVVDSKEVVLE